MSHTLELNCWILGDGPKHVFPINIESTKTVGYLRVAIKDQKKNRFDCADADDLEIWQVRD